MQGRSGTHSARLVSVQTAGILLTWTCAETIIYTLTRSRQIATIGIGGACFAESLNAGCMEKKCLYERFINTIPT